MLDWQIHNPFGEQSQFRDGEIRGIFTDQYRGHPERIKQMKQRNKMKEM